jgi:hypothetical protein
MLQAAMHLTHFACTDILSSGAHHGNSVKFLWVLLFFTLSAPWHCCPLRYNPPAGSGQTWWLTETAYGGPYPGTGRTCNPNVAKYTCTNVQVGQIDNGRYRVLLCAAAVCHGVKHTAGPATQVAAAVLFWCGHEVQL